MSEIKVNKISPRTACGTTTLGDSGDTFTIPAGVTITNSGTAAGFGATGAASWDTTVKTSSPFTAVSGVGYFVNTTAGAITVNLPAGTAGDVVAIKDYANTFDTYAVTLVQNGSDKIGGSAVNATLSVEGLAVTLVFIDATQGWLVTDSGLQSEAPGAQYIVATGGTITCSGDYRIHTFTGPGALCVSAAGNALGSNSVDYLVVAGGAGGGGAITTSSGGGGAGGYRESPGTASGSYTVSPLGASPAVALPVSVQPYSIAVGGGGAGGAGGGPGVSTPGTTGTNSSFSTITSAGGGGGGDGAGSGTPHDGKDGGSGGGSGGSGSAPSGNNGTGNTPPVSPAQGTNGGTGGGSPNQGGGAGGGATVAGANGTPTAGGNGGAGATSSINNTPTTRGGGGGGGSGYTGGTTGSAGPGGGGAGANATTGGAATINTGGGGGGTGGEGPTGNKVGGAGGSGIVIIRYKFQN